MILKRFIRYLYEYDQGKRMRNVGFVKVEQDNEECVIHVHGKGLLSGNGKELVLYLFFMQNEQCIGIRLGEISCSGPALNESWKYTKKDEDFTENFDKINGVILENEHGIRYASVWDDTQVDISQMRLFENTFRHEQSEEKPEESPCGTEEEKPEEMPCEIEEKPEESPCDTDDEKLEEGPCETVPEESFTVRSEAFPGMTISVPPKKSEFRIRKIQRMEISKLARCEWKLANNNFLMHGYYNYHHLVLLENDSQFMLGVPGIYHEKEKSAAEVFGFPKFISLDELDLTLDPEEKNEDEVFGYWCRPVKRSLRWE